VTVETFSAEIEAALRAYERHVVCLEKTPDECRLSLMSLVGKAIQAFAERGPSLRHGLALDKHLTVILSQTDTDRPHCGIYFNLHTPYHEKLPRTAPAFPERPSG